MKAPAPTKGVAPVFTGVHGVLMDSAPEGLLFGERKLKTSPYDPLLLQLKAAGAGKFLKFDDLRARPSVIARAKKLNIKVTFGEQGSILWVALAAADLQTTGTTEKQPAERTNSDIVLAAIDAKRHTAGEIVTYMRSNGSAGIGITQVDGLLRLLHRSGKIKLGVSRGDQPERWILP